MPQAYREDAERIEEPLRGTVAKVHVEEGGTVETGAKLIEVKAQDRP